MHADLAAKIAALEAELAALRAAQATPSAQQTQQTGDGGTVTDNVQVTAGNDALVLRDITIAEGGTLIVGGQPVDLPPAPEALQTALATYFRTLLERYHYLNLQGLGAGGSHQTRVALRSVFVDVRTDYTIAEATTLLGTDHESPGQPGTRGRLRDPARLSADLRRWLDELFSPEERTQLVEQAQASREDRTRNQVADALQDRLTAPRTALELIRHESALVLLGDPGSGKSTVLRHLTLGFAHVRLSATAAAARLDPELAWAGPLPLPILVQLRRFAEELSAPPDSAEPLLRHLERVLADDRLAALARHLVAQLDEGRAIVLLDGLDEIADDTRRAWASQAAALFQSRFPRSRVVITSRIYAYREPCLLPPPFRVVTLQALTTEAQNDFLGRWYQAALLHGSELVGAEQTQAATERSRELIDALDLRPRLREIASNPLLLTMIALVHQQRVRLPQQRAELYRESLQVLLEQWEHQRAGGVGLAKTLGVRDDIDRLALIQPVAYALQDRGREEASHREVCDWLLPRFLELAQDDGEHAKALIGRFLSFLEGRSGLLIARDLKARYAFPHKTFQEYLTARELIAGDTLLHEVARRRHEPTWREVILLAAGHLVAGGVARQAHAIGWALLEADPEGSDGFFRSAVLAGEVVEELGSVLGREGQALKKQVVTALVDLVQGGRLPAKERVEAAFLLGRLGDPRLPTPDQSAYWCAVPPGTFWYGDDQQGTLTPQRLAYGFKLARYPVTNAEYAAFIKAGGYERQEWWTPNGWARRESNSWVEPRYWRNSQYNSPTQPVVGISWYEAVAYSHWLTAQGHAAGWLPTEDELRLPTSLEWEHAARGSDNRRRYPWGDDAPTPEHANYQATGIGRPAPVGCFPSGAAAVCGAADLAGNVLEWMATPYDQPTQIAAKKDFTPNEWVVLSNSYYGTNIQAQLCCGSRSGYDPNDGGGSRSFRVIWPERASE